MRSFISIELPDNVKAYIFHAFEKLKKSKVCKGKFVDKDNLHLTLKFLGKITSEEAEIIKKELEKVDFRQFPVETGKVGFFPNEKFIKVLWIELLSPDFEMLKKEIDSALKNAGFDQKDKEFFPHLTVARITAVRDKKAFLEKAKELAPKKMFFIVNQFSFRKSILKKKGPEYKTLKDYSMRMRA